LKLLALIVVACTVAVAAALFAFMFRRDEPILGLAALTAVMLGAVATVAYSGMSEL
jgi:hypothetical protein